VYLACVENVICAFNDELFRPEGGALRAMEAAARLSRFAS